MLQEIVEDCIEMSIRLLSEADILAVVAELDFSDSGVREELLADPACGGSLRVYLALTAGRIGADLSPAELFYNRYFWFHRFTCQAQQKFGYDAGIEQQAFQILEYADCEIDAKLLEELVRAARTAP